MTKKTPKTVTPTDRKQNGNRYWKNPKSVSSTDRKTNANRYW